MLGIRNVLLGLVYGRYNRAPKENPEDKTLSDLFPYPGPVVL